MLFYAFLPGYGSFIKAQLTAYAAVLVKPDVVDAHFLPLSLLECKVLLLSSREKNSPEKSEKNKEPVTLRRYPPDIRRNPTFIQVPVPIQ